MTPSNHKYGPIFGVLVSGSLLERRAGSPATFAEMKVISITVFPSESVDVLRVVKARSDDASPLSHPKAIASKKIGK